MSTNSSLFLKFLTKLWAAWNIQFVVLASLVLQIFLIFIAPLRKRMKSSILMAFLWCFYLLADYTATFGIGLLSRKYGGGGGNNNSKKHELFLHTFWAPFLLVHLGGPDSITAYSLEDNQLWLRHLLHLIFQVYFTIYVFVLSLPENPLWIPTTLILVAGIIKYVERNRSLQLASLGSLRIKKTKDIYYFFKLHFLPKLTEENMVFVADKLFNAFKEIVLDMIYTLDHRMESHKYFKGLNWKEALRVIEIELNLFYDAFYTKAQVSCTKHGLFFRFVSFSCTLAALLLFVFPTNNNFKHDDMDVIVTYALLYGAVSLEVVSFFMLLLSHHHSVVFFSRNHNCSCILKLRKYILRIPSRLKYGSRLPETIPSFNLISYCLQRKENWTDRVIEYAGASDLVRQWKYRRERKLREAENEKLWDLISEELKTKSAKVDNLKGIQEMCTSRGARVISEMNLGQSDKDKLRKYVDPQVTFDQSMILWHIATDLLLWDEEMNNHDESSNKLISNVLSDYMMYLLIMQPSMMSAIRGIGHIWFEAMCSIFTRTCNNTGGEEREMKKKRLLALAELKTRALNSSIVDNDDTMMPLLFKAHLLAEAIKGLQVSSNELKWEKVAKVWVELLSYAACNVMPIAHVHQLKSGGEFLSRVWLLMTHLGLSKQFQLQEPITLSIKI